MILPPYPRGILILSQQMNSKATFAPHHLTQHRVHRKFHGLSSNGYGQPFHSTSLPFSTAALHIPSTHHCGNTHLCRLSLSWANQTTSRPNRTGPSPCSTAWGNSWKRPWPNVSLM